MSVFGQLYSSRPKDAGRTEAQDVHTPRLREKILAAGSDQQGQDDLIVARRWFLFNKDIDEALNIACNIESDMLQLSKAAQITVLMFQGKFKYIYTKIYQNESVAPVWKTLIIFILTGPHVTKQSEVIIK